MRGSSPTEAYATNRETASPASPASRRDADLTIYLPLVEPAPAWMERGACRRGRAETAVFFVSDQKRGHGELAAAKAWCAMCEVEAECLAYALARPALYGVWGGTTENQRRRTRRAAKKSRAG